MFIKIGLKLGYFCHKNTKYLSAGGSAPNPETASNSRIVAMRLAVVPVV